MSETMINDNKDILQLAENSNVDDDNEINDCKSKREMLEKTKIARQTWSISEIYKRIKSEDIILDPDYQRASVWKDDKRTAFIESLYMGIMIPPIYVVELPSKNLLAPNKYEVVDGKQRLTAITMFLDGKLELLKKHLEYYGDIFACKNFYEIQEEYSTETSEMLSSILDIYVITANSPEFTKYDIFARLNKGAEPLRVNEIRRAIYHSDVTSLIKKYIDEHINDEDYKRHFSENEIMHFDDYGRFYKSVAFVIRTDIEKGVVENYNSRPREMINTVLQELQKGKITISQDKTKMIIEKTMELEELFSDVPTYKEYLIDACIPFVANSWNEIVSKKDMIVNNSRMVETFAKSPATTSSVNK